MSVVVAFESIQAPLEQFVFEWIQYSQRQHLICISASQCQWMLVSMKERALSVVELPSRVLEVDLLCPKTKEQMDPLDRSIRQNVNAALYNNAFYIEHI
jgi:hypothetical protein